MEERRRTGNVPRIRTVRQGVVARLIPAAGNIYPAPLNDPKVYLELFAKLRKEMEGKGVELKDSYDALKIRKIPLKKERA